MKRILSILLLFIFSIILIGCVDSQVSETTLVNTTNNQMVTETQTTAQTTAQTTEQTSEQTTEPITSEITTLPVTTESTSEAVTTTTRLQEIRLFSINDFHGGTYSDISSLESIGSYIKEVENTTHNTVVLTNGDIFQGAALSNYYHGEPIVEALNNIGFDGFIIGNHEFDWGIDEILKYRDGSSEYAQMDYPIVAANIVYTDSGEPLENTVPYIIKEINGVKVGVIGLIGEIMDSISASRVTNIDFLDPTTVASDVAYELRVNQDCDIVVVYIHNGSDINNQFSSLIGDHFIDAVFNGHTHQNEASEISRGSDVEPLVYAQASNSENSLFTEISLVYDNVEGKVVEANSYVRDEFDVYGKTDDEITNILSQYQNDAVYLQYVNQVLAYAPNNYYRSDLTPWGASVIRDYAGVDVGATNAGGFRKTMYSGDITMEEMIEIYPFDNYIKTCTLTGEALKSFYINVENRDYDVTFDDALSYYNNNLYIDGVLVTDEATYTIGAVDYIFDKDDYMFLSGNDITQTTLLMRDLLVLDLLNTTNNFDPQNGTSYQTLSVIYDPNYFKELKASIII